MQTTHDVSEMVKLNLSYPGTGFRTVLVVSMIFFVVTDDQTTWNIDPCHPNVF